MSEYFSSQSADGEESGGVSVYAFLSKWCSQPWKRMADLAEAVDDLICSFDYMDTAMDNLVMLAFIWVLVTLVMLGVGRWAYGRFYKKSSVTETTNSSVTSTPSAKATSVKSVEDGASVKKVLSTANEIVSSADSVLATSAKTKTGVIRTKSTGAVGGGFVPPTPPNKRRLARMSPGPDHPIQRKTASIYVPTCTGPDPPSVQWVNEMFMWLYNDLVIVNELIQLWIVSMNEFSKKSVEEQGIGVELVRALDSNPPTISNVFCECDTKNDVTITADCEATPAFQLKAFRQKGDKVEVAHYRVNVNRFRARLSITCITDKLTGELRCDGWPEVKVALAPVGPLRPNADEANLQDLVSEIVVSALRNTSIEFNFSPHPTCPRLRRHYESPGRLLPLHYDSMLASSQSGMYTSTPSSSPTGQSYGQGHGVHGDRRLLVKIVGARDLGGKAGCHSPYCVVEMDEPAQKNQTGVKKETTSPNWDEHFLFDLSHNTAELLFEVYDRTPVAPATTSPSPSPAPHRFLGLGIVGIDELLVSPSQRQLISLQGKPMEEQDVTGVLTVEFLFIEGADIPDMGKPFKLKETLRTVSPSGQTLTTTKTTFKQNGQDRSHLTETALRELELSPTNSANKSTLIIHSVQREPSKTIKVEITESGHFVEVENQTEIENHTKVKEEGSKIENGDVPNVAAIDTDIETNPNECANTNTNNASPTKTVTIVEAVKSNGFDEIAEIGDTLTGMGEAGDYVNHSLEVTNGVPQPAPRQKKRRDFFGTIKRRLGRSKTRGASVDNPESGSDMEQHMRSISADRTGHPDNALNIPNRMNQRNVYSAGASPAQSGDESRTSRSEMSGVSAASGRTFIHEASTLVLETVEAGIKKHYLVPLAIAQRSRWRRKGVKLHIYNEHTFIAKHLSGGTACQVCRMNVARRIGKQGYECRDCLLKCHKHCHVKVPETCPQTTVPNMELSHSHSFGNGRSMLPVLSE